MIDVARWVTIELAALAFILTCLSALLLLDRAEVKLAAKMHVAAATYEQDAPPEGCTPDSLKPVATDLRSFDPRMGGYTREEATALLCIMHANEKRAAHEYIDNRYYWDMLFPIVYGPGVAIVLLFLVGRSGLSGWWAFAAMFLPLAGAGFDIAENLAVRALIETGPTANATDMDFASRLTAIKYALVLPAFVVGTLGMLAVLARRSFKLH